jgi:hypothetical protein
MIQEQKRLSLCLNVKLVLPTPASATKGVPQELQCSLCQAVLVEPMRCIECKSNFHQACLNKFCRETGACPLMCKKPKFVSMKRELEKPLNELKFGCQHQDLGCDKVLSYQEAMTHDRVCKYGLVKCAAYKECRTKCMRKDLELH